MTLADAWFYFVGVVFACPAYDNPLFSLRFFVVEKSV
jgi:hypothetical protein